MYKIVRVKKFNNIRDYITTVDESYFFKAIVLHNLEYYIKKYKTEFEVSESKEDKEGNLKIKVYENKELVYTYICTEIPCLEKENIELKKEIETLKKINFYLREEIETLKENMSFFKFSYDKKELLKEIEKLKNSEIQDELHDKSCKLLEKFSSNHCFYGGQDEDVYSFRETLYEVLEGNTNFLETYGISIKDLIEYFEIKREIK